jgi:hypothetical protein
VDEEGKAWEVGRARLQRNSGTVLSNLCKAQCYLGKQEGLRHDSKKKPIKSKILRQIVPSKSY